MRMEPGRSPANPGADRPAPGRRARLVWDNERDRNPGLRPTRGGRAVAWGLAAALTLANVAGYAFDLYQRFWWFDRILHACTLFALTFCAAVFLCGKVLNGSADHRLIRVLLIAGVGVAVGAWWEVAEWGFDQLMPADVIKGKHDTVIDLVVDTFGAVLAARSSLWVLRPATAAEAGEAEPDDA